MSADDERLEFGGKQSQEKEQGPVTAQGLLTIKYKHKVQHMSSLEFGTLYFYEPHINNCVHDTMCVFLRACMWVCMHVALWETCPSLNSEYSSWRSSSCDMILKHIGYENPTGKLSSFETLHDVVHFGVVMVWMVFWVTVLGLATKLLMHTGTGECL